MTGCDLFVLQETLFSFVVVVYFVKVYSRVVVVTTLVGSLSKDKEDGAEDDA